MEGTGESRGDRVARLAAGTVLFVPAVAVSFAFPEHFRFPKLVAGEGLAFLGALATVAAKGWWGGRPARWTDYAWDLTVGAAIISLLVVSTHPLTGWQEVVRLASYSVAYSLFRQVDRPWRLAPLVLLAAVVNAGLANLQAMGLGFWETAREGRHAIYGTFGNPNLLAEFLAPALLVALAWPGRVMNRVGVLVGIVLPIELIATLGTTQARAAGVAALAGFLLFLYLKYRGPGSAANGPPTSLQKSTALVFGVFMVTAVLGTSFGRGSGLAGVPDSTDPTVSTRTFMAHVALDQFRQSPVLGAGPGGYGLGFLDTGAGLLATTGERPGYAGITREAHNDPLQLMAERGGLGLVAGVVALLLVLRGGWTGGGASGPGAVAVLSTLGLASLFGFPTRVMPTGLLMAWALTCLARVRAPGEPGAVPTPLVVGRTLLLAGAGLWLVGRTAYAEGAMAVGSPRALQDAIHVLPAYGEPHFRFGLALERAGRLAEAETEFEAARPGFPDPDVWFNLGWIALQRKNFALAADRFHEGLRRYPFFKAPAWADDALALRGLGRREEAIVAANRALAIDPGLGRARILLTELERGRRKK